MPSAIVKILKTKTFFIILLMALCLLPFYATASDTKPINLKVVSPYPAGTFTNQLIEWYIESLEQESNGSLNFTNFWGGSLLKGKETLEGLQHGVADIALLIPGYSPGKLPLAFSHYAFPFAPRSAEMMSEIIEELYNEFPFMTQEWTNHNLKPIYNGTVSDYGILSKMPMTRLQDFHGKKLAQLGGHFASWTQASGIQPISGMTASERYERLRNGIVDGSLLTPSFFVDFKEYEVSKYCIMTGLGARVPFFVVINMKVWNKLPHNIQKVMMKVGKNVQLKHAIATDEKLRSDLNLLQSKGIQYNGYLSSEDIKQWADTVPNTPEKMCKSLENRYPEIRNMAKRFVELAKEKGHEWPRDFKLN